MNSQPSHPCPSSRKEGGEKEEMFQKLSTTYAGLVTGSHLVREIEKCGVASSVFAKPQIRLSVIIGDSENKAYEMNRSLCHIH